MNILIRCRLLLMVLLVAQTALGEEEASASRFRLAAIPAFGYDPDNGAGGGVVGNLYLEKEGYDPYKMALGFKAYISTKLMNSHALKYEQVRAFGLPLRLTGRVGFFSSMAQNYCGMASDARCDEDRAKMEAKRLDIAQSEHEQFVRQYYLNRLMYFYGDIFSRWLLWQNQAKLELMAGYHGTYYLNRDFKNKGPYPGSLFQRDFHTSKLDGYLSMLQLGLMLDSRDNEIAPTSGYWLEGSIRGAASFTGSSWDFFGQNLAARFYLPLDDGHKLVIASQTIVDNVIGDLPYDAMSRLGGSVYMSDFSAIGGQNIGRGIREQLFVGRFKAIEQLEFRYNFWSFDLWRQHFDLTAAAFGDIGMTAWDFSRFTTDMKSVHLSFGSGLRINWNNFVIRGDLGFSAVEDFGPRFYLAIGNVF